MPVANKKVFRLVFTSGCLVDFLSATGLNQDIHLERRRLCQVQCCFVEPGAGSRAVRRFASERSSQTLDATNGSPYWCWDEARAKRGFVVARILWRPLTKTRSLESYGEMSINRPSIRSSTTDHESFFERPLCFQGRQGAPPFCRWTWVHHGNPRATLPASRRRRAVLLPAASSTAAPLILVRWRPSPSHYHVCERGETVTAISRRLPR